MKQATAEVNSISLRRLSVPQWLAPLLIALFFTLWSFRGFAPGNLIDTDATRHVMNGVFLHDYASDVLAGKAAVGPMEYARLYYSRLPALSLPYHPPVFPAVEAVFFFVFGINLFAARLAVALAVGISAFLMYRLVLATHASHALAAASTVTFFALPWSLNLAGDVMLEYPSLAFSLGAVYYLRDIDRDFPLRRGLAFALLAGAALWTKQTVVFLGAIPFLAVAVSGNWRILRGKTIWIASALFGAAAAGVAAFAALSESAGNSTWPRTPVWQIATHNFWYYLGETRDGLPYLRWALLLAVAGAAVVLGRRAIDRRRDILYLAWGASAMGILLAIPPYDGRYLFVVYVAVVPLGYALLYRAARVLTPRRAWAAPAVLAAVSVAVNIRQQPEFIEGPPQAAAAVAAAKAPARILYCGKGNGTFIFAMRMLDPSRRHTVIRGDKLPPEVFEPGVFEDFAHGFGIDYIIAERQPVSRPWDKVSGSYPSVAPWRELKLASSVREMNGALRMFRFTNPSPNPQDSLVIKSMSGADLKVTF